MKKFTSVPLSAVPSLYTITILLVCLFFTGWITTQTGFGLNDWMFLALNSWVVVLLVSWWCFRQYEFIWQYGIALSTFILISGFWYFIPSSDLGYAQPLANRIAQDLPLLHLPDTFAVNRALSTMYLSVYLLTFCAIVAAPLSYIFRRLLKLVHLHKPGLRIDRKLDNTLETISLNYGFSRPGVLLTFHCLFIILVMFILILLA